MTTPDISSYSPLQLIKRRFFAMRNGIIADTLRKAGSPFPMIFGLNLPQIAEIARDFAPDPALGRQLWADTRTRESMMAAPMLLAPSDITRDEAHAMIAAAPCREVVDILCHRLLRHRSDALEIARESLDAEDADGSEMRQYAGIRLLWNLVNSAPATILPLAEAEAARQRPTTAALATALVDEARWLLEPDSQE